MSNYKYRCKKEVRSSKTYELVVSWYNEDLSWIEELIPKYFKITVYSKLHKSHPNYDVICIDNVGRETHTFMYHIYNNYDSLSDVTLFAIGSVASSAFGFLKRKKLKYALNNMSEIDDNGIVFLVHYEPGLKIPYEPDFVIADWNSTTASNHIHNSNGLQPASVRPYSKWYNTFIGDEEKIKRYGMSFNSVFGVSSKAIRFHSKDKYKRLVRELSFSNPEAGHFLERSIYSMFHF